MQNWIKHKLIITPQMLMTGYSHAAVPVVMHLHDDLFRIYFSSRNSLNQSIPFSFDFNIVDEKITEKISEPLMQPGALGCFDDSGVMPACLLTQNNKIFMYYIGWNLGVTVPFRNAIGLAVNEGNGTSFKRVYNGPILDRNKSEPHFTASCHVIFDNGIYKMWYLSCVKWDKIENKIMHFYNIKYAESADGVEWNRNGHTAIDFLYKDEYAISVPRVIKENGTYKMWYSYRAGTYSKTYRIGYAESLDGKDWKRKDDEVCLDVTPGCWDSDMICYPFVFDHNQKRYMLYNGNGFGESGIGLAVLEN